MAHLNGSKVFKTRTCGEQLRVKGLHVSHTLREEAYGSEKIADCSDSLCILQQTGGSPGAGHMWWRHP